MILTMNSDNFLKQHYMAAPCNKETAGFCEMEAEFYCKSAQLPRLNCTIKMYTILKSCWLNDPQFNSQYKLFLKCPDQILQATQPPTKGVQGALSPDIKWLGSESVHRCVKHPVMFH
jgi:hypothetical protein